MACSDREKSHIDRYEKQNIVRWHSMMYFILVIQLHGSVVFIQNIPVLINIYSLSC